MGALVGYREVTALMAAFFARLITCGCVYSWGIFFEPFQSFFRLSNLQTSTVFALTQGLTQGAGLVAPFLLKRFTFRQVIIFGGLLASLSTALSSFVHEYWAFVGLFGLLQGLGHGLVYVTVPIAASFILPGHRSHVAIALHNSGDGFGLVLFPLLIEVLLELFTWHQAVLLISVIQLHSVLCGLWLNVDRTSKEKNKTNNDLIEVQKCREAPPWRKTNILLLVASSFLDSLGCSAYFTFIFAHLEHHTLSASSATVVLSTAGAVSIAGRLLVSFFDEKCLPRWFSFAIAHLAQGICICVMAASPPSMELFLICASILGLSSGIGGALLCCVCKDVCGENNLTLVFSSSMFAWGVGSMVGPPIAGLLKDLTGSSVLPLTVGGAAFIASGALLLLFFFTVDWHVTCLSKKSRAVDTSYRIPHSGQSVDEHLFSLPN